MQADQLVPTLSLIRWGHKSEPTYETVHKNGVCRKMPHESIINGGFVSVCVLWWCVVFVKTYTEPAASYLHGQPVYTGHQQGVVVQQGGTVTTIVTSQTVQQVTHWGFSSGFYLYNPVYLHGITFS